MKKLKAVWELMRLGHGVMLIIAIIIGSVIGYKIIHGTIGFPPYYKFLLAFFTALFLEASTFALNDYFDLEIDKNNKRTDRPLVRGDLSPKTALILFGILFPLGIICSYFVNLTCFIIALVTAFLAIFYDVKLKKIKILGNFYIAYAMAVPFIFGGATVLQQNTFTLAIPQIIYIIAFIAFLAGVGREIMKDVMDVKGDKKEGVKSFPTTIGIRKSNTLAAMFYIIAIALSFLPFMSRNFDVYYQNYYYLVVVLVTDVMLIATASLLFTKKELDMKFHRTFTLVALFIGLLAFLIGAFTG